jgi:hypothetical protein
MFMRNKLGLALVGLGLAAAFDANAFFIPAGPVEIHFDGVDASTVNYVSGVNPPGTDICATGAACDTAASQPPSGAPSAMNIAGLGWEDSWGVGNISYISDPDTLETLWASSPAERLTAMLYGIVDTKVTYTGPSGGNDTFTALAQGGFMDIYLRAGSSVDITGGPAARTGLDTYPTAAPGILDPSLFLRLAFSPGVALGDLTHTFQSSFNTGVVAAQGSGYLDVIGGSHASAFNNQSITDPNGGKHNFQFDVTVSAANAPFSWTVRAEGQLTGEAPVPAPIFLMGIGLLGLARMRRRAA